MSRPTYASRRDEYLLGASCVRCGSTDRLELDHIDPSSKSGRRLWEWSEEAFMAEVVKCQWLCQSCHINKTVAEAHAPDWQRNPAAVEVIDWLRRHGFVANDNRPVAADPSGHIQRVSAARRARIAGAPPCSGVEAAQWLTSNPDKTVKDAAERFGISGKGVYAARSRLAKKGTVS